MRRALIISCHFPPDASAGTHRARVVAPYLAPEGWLPTVLTVDDPRGGLPYDPELAAALPASLDVERVRPLARRWTRFGGVGDLGLRSLPALHAKARALARRSRFDVVYITTYPVYPALLGPSLERQFACRFVLDMQDPWVGAWGDEVGPGPGGTPDLKSRVSRALAVRLESRVVPHARACTGVSSALLDELCARYPALRERPRAVLPIGVSPSDVAWVDAHPDCRSPLPVPDTPRLVYVGTLLPLGHTIVRRLFEAMRQLRASRPELAGALRTTFVGTSNQADDHTPRVMPIAHECGVADLVDEHPARVPFFDALRLLRHSTGVLVLGTSEARYTASKLDTALASGRKVFAVFHGESDVARALGPASATDPALALVTYGSGDTRDLTARIARALETWLAHSRPAVSAAALLESRTGPALARELARLFDRVTEGDAS